MNKKRMIAALMCAGVLSASAVTGSGISFAEEETAEAVEEVTEADTEEDADDVEKETEESIDLTNRPDYHALDYVELGEYKGLTVQLEPQEVTDADVLAQIRAIAGSDILVDAEDDTIQEGDIANIDYEGAIDGESFEGGIAKDYNLEIGSGDFIEGFEDGLLGVKTGETVELNLTFPDNYTEDLAGKDVVFTVTVNSVKRMPELTSEMVSKISDGEYSDVEVYKEYIRSQLEQDNESSRTSRINSDLVAQISASSTITEYPQELVNYVVANMTNYYKQLAEESGMDFAEFLEQYMSLSEEEFSEQVILVAEQNLQAELYLKAIAEKEGIELSDEEYEERCAQFAENYGYESVEAFLANYEESEIRVSALESKVLDFVRENAVIEEVQEDQAEGQTEPETEGEPESEISAE